jgi:hypothetical protein
MEGSDILVAFAPVLKKVHEAATYRQIGLLGRPKGAGWSENAEVSNATLI